MKAIVPVALGVTCLGFPSTSNHQVEGFVVATPTGERCFLGTVSFVSDSLHAVVDLAYVAVLGSSAPTLSCC